MEKSRKIDLKFAEVTTPLFISGKNLGLKMDHRKFPSIGLQYDRDDQELLVTWEGETGIVPKSLVVCMIEGKPMNITPQEMHPMVAGLRSAQVGSPQAHVHAGPGQGQTGLGGKVK